DTRRPTPDGLIKSNQRWAVLFSCGERQHSNKPVFSENRLKSGNKPQKTARNLVARVFPPYLDRCHIPPSIKQKQLLSHNSTLCELDHTGRTMQQKSSYCYIHRLSNPTCEGNNEPNSQRMT
ncbi:MAG: hypothetical protein ACRC0H_07025, partial [Aeromonas sobria]